MITNKTIKLFFLFTMVSFLVSSCGCSDKDCKSTRDCGNKGVCKNGQCIDNNPPSSDSDTRDGDSDSASASDSANDTDTDSLRDTDSSIDTNTDNDSDTDTDTTTDNFSDSDSNSDTDTTPRICNEAWECNDDNECTVDNCTNGRCSYSQTTPLPSSCCTSDTECNDNDICTIDQCNATSGKCDNTVTASESCCISTSDCDDGNSCTVDSCGLEKKCIHVPDPTVSGCCANINDCGSSNCSTITCVDYSCAYSVTASLQPGCCVVAEDCPPGEGACAVASCTPTGQCEYETNATLAENCCVNNSDCDDGNDCNIDVCTFEYTCSHAAPSTPATGCCINDGDCSDGDNCTADSCVDNRCVTSTPDPLPAGCCGQDTDCDDWNPCTRDICLNGHCISNGDPNLGTNCCYGDTDCNDSNPCTSDSCDSWSSECVYLAPSAGDLPASCCLVDDDCFDSDNLCNIGSCGLDPKYTCEYSAAADNAPCDNDSWCDGPEVCSGGSCVTRTDDVPCNGPLGVCRLGDCNDTTKQCVVAAEYDTDVSCDDGFFCNGEDVCMDGDCVHPNPPCVPTDTDSLGACEELSCNESSDICEVAFKPDYTSCENNALCDGANMCVEGVCETSDYCGRGNDCAYYDCHEDTDGGLPICELVYAANGVPCSTPDLGACFGTLNRKCLNGTCTIGSDPMCNITGGFCKDYICMEAWGPGDIPSGGCGEDSSDYSFFEIGCTSFDTDSAPDTDAGIVMNTTVFSTALEHNRVDNYGATCGSGYSGGDSIYEVSLTSGQQITATISNVQTTSGGAATVMILTDACNPSSCVDFGTTSVTHTAGTDGTYYVVVDMNSVAYATGTLTIDCN